MGRISHPNLDAARSRALNHPVHRSAYELLTDRWMTAREVATALGETPGTVAPSLTRLVSLGLVTVAAGEPTGATGRPVNRYHALANGDPTPQPPARDTVAMAAGVFHLAAAVRARRQALGLSQKELGQRVGLQQSDISDAETGLLPTLPRLARIAAALGVEMWQLLRAAQEWAATDGGEPA